MTRSFRTRVQKTDFRQGSLVIRTGTTTGSRFNSTSGVDGDLNRQCQDWHGRPVSDGTLNVQHRDRRQYVPINGHYLSPNGATEITATEFIPTQVRSLGLSHLSLPSRPDPGSSMLDLLNRTNPSRPDYVPLSLLQDLVDIPKQLKEVGRLIRTPLKHLTSPKEVANHYLGWQFGWKPLFQDVTDLLDLQGHINRRIGELHKLYANNGLKRRLHLGMWANSSQSGVTTESIVPVMSVSVKRSIMTKSERWGTVRWLPTVTLPNYNPSDAEIISKARQVSLGLSVEGTLKGAWDLIPWTWVLNWFTNVGSFALQYSNTVPAHPVSASIMTRSETLFQDYDPQISPQPGLSGGFGDMVYVSKERYVGPATLSAHIPFIGNDRLSILGALAIQRFKR